MTTAKWISVFWLLSSIASIGISTIYAQNTSNQFFIIPAETTGVQTSIDSITQGTEGTVRDRYNTQADVLSNEL